ncbi:glycosyltransferase family 4 protein [Haladaptatus sp. NG-SE-30]
MSERTAGHVGSESSHVLGLTNMRVEEMKAPFNAMGSRGTLLTVDPSEGVRAYLTAFVRGRRLLSKRDSDAVLVYSGAGLLGVLGVLLSQWADVPLLVRQNGDVVRQHDESLREYWYDRDWWSLVVQALFASLTRITFRLADGYVPVSAALAAVVQRQTETPSERIVPVPNPVEVDEYDGPERGIPFERTTNGDLLLTVTNLDFHGKYEGVTEIVAAMLPILRQRPDVEYIVAGDGRYYEPLKRFLDEHISDPTVRRRVHAPGFVDDIAAAYAAADLFLYASYIDGYPNVVLEAQAAGLPIVTNPAYGIVEQIDDGESGLLVKARDGEAFARRVRSLLDDPEERARLGRNAQRRVQVENSAKAIGEQLSDAVEAIVAIQTDGNDRSRPPSELRSRGDVGE